jgi:hypothetical protein
MGQEKILHGTHVAGIVARLETTILEETELQTMLKF